MVSQVIKDSFINLYSDDYKDSDNYYKILFNNGRGLQQRELNQMQTILNKDIESLGQFLLDPGAATAGGTMTVSEAPFIRLDTVTSPLPSNVTALEGVIFEETTSGIQVQVQKVVEPSDGVVAQIFVKYVDQAGEEVTTDPITISNTSSPLVAQDGSGVTLTTSATDNVSNPLTGTGLIVVQNQGRFYVDEHFVFSPKQVLVLSNDTTDIEATVGHVVTESIVTVNDDENLYDNSGANLNLAAPGADRYKIVLTLTNEADIDPSDYFIPQIEITDGALAKDKNEGLNQLRATEDFLAIRLKEIHGNFTQQNFIIDFQEDEDDDDAFKVIINPGKAYVGGTRVVLRSGKTLTEAKPRTTKVVNNDTTTISYGNYVIVSNLETLFDFSTAEKLTLKDAINGGGTTIGSARVRAIEEFGSNFKVYLFDIKTNTGKNFAATKSLGITAGYSDIVLENGICKLYDQPNRNLFFDLNKSRPKSFSDIVTTVQKLHTGTANGSGEITINAATGRAFDDTGSWIVVNESTDTDVTASISSSGSSATVSGLTSGESYKILAYEQHSGSSGTVKTKTSKNSSNTRTPNASGVAYLSKVDVYSIRYITDNTTSADVTDDYLFNNGQTESFYGRPTVTLKGGATPPAGTITIAYKYFDWSATGDFFAASSYTGTIDYEDIPSFRQSNGETVELRDVIDFRPAQDGSSYDVLPLPRNGDLVTMDTEYYLPVAGRIFVKQNGTFGVYFGEPAFEPLLEDLGNDLDVMEIAHFYCNPYMLSADDVSLTYTQNKRYTMRDIANMDEKIEELKEFTTLSLLELSSANKDILDDDGLNRLKSGITADNFVDHFQTDTDDDEHSAAMDFIEGVVRPRTATNNIELVFDSDLSSGVRKKGDMIFIDYDEIAWQNQKSASRLVGVSEMVINKYTGSATVSPASDNWLDTERLPKKVITGNPRASVKIGDTYRYHDVSWRGMKISDLSKAQNGDVVATGTGTTTSSTSGGKKSTTSTKDRRGGITTTTKVSKQVTTRVTKTPEFKIQGSTVVKESLGEFVRARLSIPTMRSRFLSFRFTGLRPNTRHFAFFGKKSVDDWVYAVGGASEFTRMSDLPRTSDFLDAGDIYGDATEYPLDGGPTQIITDADGVVSGYFLIPNTDSINFATGRQTFELLDISTPSRVKSTSNASFKYEANGTLEEVQEEVLSTRIYQIRHAIRKDQTSTTMPATSNSVYTAPPPPVVQYDSCFVKGTKVRMADGSIKNIEDVQIFDKVMGQEGANMVTSYDHWPLGGRDLIGINNSGPFKTPEHPLMTRQGWKAFNSETTKLEKPEIAYLMVNGNLEVGDEVLMDDGTWTEIKSLEVFENEPEQVVYNFYLDGDHTYYADGILAHNRCDVSDGGDCCW